MPFDPLVKAQRGRDEMIAQARARRQGQVTEHEAASLPPAPAENLLSAMDATTFREEAMKDGFKPVAVYTGQKRPIGNGWQAGHGFDQLIPARLGQHNTGILTAGFRAIDIDVDDPVKAAECERVIVAKLGPTITRFRSNSSRVLLLYRAAEGAPTKQVRDGALGKVEVLGAGQQFVAHGTHPSGAIHTWRGDRGPHNTHISDLPTATEAQIAEVLAEIALILGGPAEAERTGKSGSAEVVPLLGRHAAIFDRQTMPNGTAWPDLNTAANANLTRKPHFEDLTSGEMFRCLRALVCSGLLDPLADASREHWLRVLFGFAHAAHLAQDTAGREQAGAGSAAPK